MPRIWQAVRSQTKKEINGWVLISIDTKTVGFRAKRISEADQFVYKPDLVFINKVIMSESNELDYDCHTSVAPQHLQTATITIRPDALYDGEPDDELYELKPHMLVITGANDNNELWCTSRLKKSTKADNCIFSGISLEPIVDGRLARQNPQSTAKTAIAVGGVVSVAVPRDSSHPMGHTLYFDFDNDDCYADDKKFTYFVPQSTGEEV